MKLTPKLIRELQAAAKRNGDDTFFGIKMLDGDFFVFNWVLGLSFHDKEVMRCPHISTLEDETDRVCGMSASKKDIVHHIRERGWQDILTGKGILYDADFVQARKEEEFIFAKRKLPALPFETKNGIRYFVRETYFDLADRAIGDITPFIFRPAGSSSPRNYRPMLFQDRRGSMKGLIHTIDDENMRNPLSPLEKWKEEIAEIFPKLL